MCRKYLTNKKHLKVMLSTMNFNNTVFNDLKVVSQQQMSIFLLINKDIWDQQQKKVLVILTQFWSQLTLMIMTNSLMILPAWPWVLVPHDCTPIQRKKQQGNYSSQTKHHTAVYEPTRALDGEGRSGSLRSAHSRGGDSTGSNWTCKRKWTIRHKWRRRGRAWMPAAKKWPIRGQEEEVNGFMEVRGAQRKGNFWRAHANTKQPP